MWRVSLDFKRCDRVLITVHCLDCVIRLFQDLITNVFRSHAEHGGVRVVDFHTVTKQVCDLPSYCSAALFLKLQPLCPQSLGIVTMEAFLQYGIAWHHVLVVLLGLMFFFVVLCGRVDVIFLSLSLSLSLSPLILLTHPCTAQILDFGARKGGFCDTIFSHSQATSSKLSNARRFCSVVARYSGCFVINKNF
jgi:hypothetical protein